MKTLWEKNYHGFESISDLERDVYEALDDVSGEFQGTIKVVITYEPAETEKKC